MVQFIKDVLEYVFVRHDAASQDNGIRIGDPDKVHYEVGDSLRGVLHEHTAELIPLLTKPDDIPDIHPDSFIGRDLKAGIVPVLEQSGAGVKAASRGD